MSNYIHTTHRGPLLAAYDRKSPRHNWQLIVTDLPSERARIERKASTWAERAHDTPGWESYEQRIVTLEIGDDGIIPDNMRPNFQFEQSCCVMVQGALLAQCVSDDDICSDCGHLLYCPGELSLCKLAEEIDEWPGRMNDDGYYTRCNRFERCRRDANFAFKMPRCE